MEHIFEYFHRGYSYNEILSVLHYQHDVDMSIRQLHRTLRLSGLYRKGHHSAPNDIISFIADQISGSGSCLGYRQMHQRCIQMGIKVTRRTVSLVQKHLDPDGVELRKRNRLKRRLYYSRGPNWVWHIDGYDKLKPFGFSIHGAVDGFSRKVLWLELCKSNKDPKVICSFYLQQVKSIEAVPLKVVGDRGTENVYIAAAQKYFCKSIQSFQYGRSISNQRIEAWWSILRRSCTNWWINFFKDLVEQGIYDLTDPIHVECIRFCFGNILRSDLNQVIVTWNNHRIRRGINTHDQIRPNGIPNILYSIPVIFNRSIGDYKFAVNAQDIEVVNEVCCTNEDSSYLCSNEFYVLANILMSENMLSIPTNSNEALSLFLSLSRLINQI